MKFINCDMWIGGGAIALASIGWFFFIPLGVDVPSSVKLMALSPDFWPRIIMAILAFCGLVVLLQGIAEKKSSYRNGYMADDTPEDEEEEITYYNSRKQGVRLIAAFAGLFGFYLLSPLIGMVVGCIILVIAATRLLGVVSWTKSMLLAILLPVLLYLFFTEVAYVPIPLGLFEELR